MGKVVLFCGKHILEFLETWEGKYYMCFRTGCRWIDSQRALRKYASAFVIQECLALSVSSITLWFTVSHRLPIGYLWLGKHCQWARLSIWVTKKKAVPQSGHIYLIVIMYLFCSFSCLYSHLSGLFLCNFREVMLIVQSFHAFIC